MKKLKLTALLVTMAMTASLAGCGNSASEETTDSTQLSQATATQEAVQEELCQNDTIAPDTFIEPWNVNILLS